MHGRLVTNEYRFRIGLATVDLCPRCSHAPKTIEHILQDCFHSRGIWEQFIPPTHVQSFFATPFNLWIKDNALSVSMGLNDVGWCQFFLALLWGIWLQRNEIIFNGLEFSPYNVIRQATNLTLDIQIPLDQFGITGPDIANGRWTKPPPGYLKPNVDGSFRDGRAAFGGVLRDHHGMWIWPYGVLLEWLIFSLH